mgnify:CR=1 FL=1
MNDLQRVTGVKPALGGNVGRVRLFRRVIQAKRLRLPINPDSRAEEAGLVRVHAQVSGRGSRYRCAPILAVGSMRHIPEVANPVVGPIPVHVVDLASGPLAIVYCLLGCSDSPLSARRSNHSVA